MMTEIEQVIKAVMEEHELDEKAHADATGEMVAEAVVEALKRVRSHLDRAELKSINGANGDANESTGTTPSTSRPEAPASPVQVFTGPNEHVNPAKVVHNYDDDGRITESVAVFDKETEGE